MYTQLIIGSPYDQLYNQNNNDLYEKQFIKIFFSEIKIFPKKKIKEFNKKTKIISIKFRKISGLIKTLSTTLTTEFTSKLLCI